MFCSCAKDLAAYVKAIHTGQSQIHPGTFLKVGTSVPERFLLLISTF
jgi:hypothetical protein